MAAFPEVLHYSKVTGDPTQRVLDWKLELLCVAQELDELPPQARIAVLATVADFVHEDAQALVQ
jgi:hypothetical protein